MTALWPLFIERGLVNFETGTLQKPEAIYLSLGDTESRISKRKIKIHIFLPYFWIPEENMVRGACMTKGGFCRFNDKSCVSMPVLLAGTAGRPSMSPRPWGLKNPS